MTMIIKLHYIATHKRETKLQRQICRTQKTFTITRSYILTTMPKYKVRVNASFERINEGFMPSASVKK